MVGGSPFDGNRPRTAGATADEYDPVVSEGEANWGVTGDLLTEGGLFDLVGKQRRPLVIEAMHNPGAATIEATNLDGSVTVRTLTALTTPFKLGANETIKVSAGANGSTVGFLVRIDGEKIF
jgi:hypothetical protein